MISKTSYSQLFHVGDISNSTKKALAQICKFYCKETHVSLILESFKVSEFCYCEVKIAEYLRSYVVQEFVCVGCIGVDSKPYQNQNQRTFVSLQKIKSFSALKARNGFFKSKCDEIYFKVIETASSAFRPKVQEMLYIKWRKSTLNCKKQQVSLLTSLPLFRYR